jgi:BarA-like signal transduction histidine kinase
VLQLGTTAFQAVLALVDDKNKRHNEAMHHVVSGLPTAERSATELLIEEAAAACVQVRMYI